jgi:hypothetical protein
MLTHISVIKITHDVFDTGTDVMVAGTNNIGTGGRRDSR